VPLRKEGNIGLQRTGDLSIEAATATEAPTYLVVRSAAEGFWFLDGREADGTYAGYGQLYRIDDAPHTLSTVLASRSAVGASITLAFILAVASVGVGPTLLRHRRRRRRHAGDTRD
jgi:hypothetical protein